MNSKEIKGKELETRKKRKPFKNHHLMIRIAFIISSIALAWAIVFGVIFFITQKPGIIGVIFSLTQKSGFIGVITIEATIIAIALIGLVLSSISFSKGFNGYNISGFITNIVVMAIYIASIVAVIGLWFQR
ncbi:MAG: hypothetical protein ACTSSB_14980 [Candidatus Heimdallarchaeota archaeon]